MECYNIEIKHESKRKTNHAGLSNGIFNHRLVSNHFIAEL